MPLQKFRDKQKLIYWVVALVVIPTFVLLGYTQLFIQTSGSMSVGTIYGKSCSQTDFNAFFQRMRAVSFGQPVYFTLDGYRPSFPERYGMFVYMSLVKSAKKYGIEVSQDEIDTFIRYQFNYQGNNPAELQKQVERAIGSIIRLDSLYEYRLAVSEWLLARKFLALLDNSLVVPETVGALSFAQDKTQYKYRSLTIPADKFKDDATKEIDALTPDEMQSRVAGFITNNQKEQNRNRYPWLWSKPLWKFDYIMAPFVVPDLEPKITEEKLKDYYNQNKNAYKEKDGKEKPFAEIREKVENDFRQQARRMNATQTINNEFSRFLRRQAVDGTGKDIIITAEKINTDPRLVSLGMKAGVSDEKALDAVTIMENPAFAKSGMSFALSTIEQALQNARKKSDEEYTRTLKSYTTSFRGMSYAAFNMDAAEGPISGENGLYKVRIIDYVPAEPLSLQTATAEQKEELQKNIRLELISEMAMEKARIAAVAAMGQMEKDVEEVDGIKVEVKESTYVQLQGSARALADATLGKVFDPTTSDRPEGYTLLQLIERKIPQAKTADAVTDMQTMQRMWRGNSSYSIESSMNPRIKIGARFYAFYIQMSNEKAIEASNLLAE